MSKIKQKLAAGQVVTMFNPDCGGFRREQHRLHPQGRQLTVELSFNLVMLINETVTRACPIIGKSL
jgi:hypothetical protein